MSDEKGHRCEQCRWRAYAERRPDTILGRLWRWHTRWCPGWKDYQRTFGEERAREADGATKESTD